MYVCVCMCVCVSVWCDSGRSMIVEICGYSFFLIKQFLKIVKSKTLKIRSIFTNHLW